MPRQMSRWGLGVAMLFGFAPLATASPAHLVVVHKNGVARSYALREHALRATPAVCDGDDVLFVFTTAPSDGVETVNLQRGVDSAVDIGVEVVEICSNIDGHALVPFDAGGGTAVRGTDYTANAGMANLTLSRDGGGTGTTATVSVQVLSGSGSDARSFNILRQVGSFQGMGASGSPAVGPVPGSDTPVVVVNITGGTPIDDAADTILALDPAAQQLAGPTQDFCSAGGGGADAPGCAATRDAANLIGNPDTPPAVRDAASQVLENNLRAVAPDETTALAFNGRELVLRQENNLSQRLAALHTRSAATGGASFDGLTLVSGGLPLSLAGIGDALAAAGGDDPDSDNQANEEKRTLLGGTRWGVWVNGTLGGSERDRVNGNAGFDNDTWSLTSGIDYRFTNHLFGGAAIGFSRLDSDFSDDQGSLEADARSLHVYGGYSADSGLALDASISYTRSDYELKRAIELYQLTPDGTGFTSLGRQIAASSPDVGQFDASLGLTWTFMHEAWTFAPQIQYLYLSSHYSAFTEQGPSAFNLSYDKRDDNGTSLSAGIYVDRTFATSVGAFRPYTRLLYYADSGGSPDDLFASFLLPNDDGSHTPVRLKMAGADDRYGTIELGLGYSRPIGTRTVDFNLGAMEFFDADNLSRWALRLDARVPF
jgi:outer membrane autotransporter protein